MTIEIVPPAVSPWRGAYPVPKDLDLDNGPWCSMDLGAGLIPEQHGWVCASCGAWWNQHGRNGRWLTARTVLLVDGRFVERQTPDAGVADAGRQHHGTAAAIATVLAAVVLGAGFRAGQAMREHAGAVPQTALLTVSLILIGLLLIALGLVAARRWWEVRREQ